MRRAWAVAVAWAAAAAACGQPAIHPGALPAGGEATAGQALAAAASEVAAEAGAEGAFCKEHGVLEAVCTSCTPALIPVFQAKGDWCKEHAFPESFCPTCHPERRGRPAVDVQGDGAPGDGTKVAFTSKETARWAGIRVVKATERPRQSEIAVTAKIVCDASKVAEVTARSAGVLRSILVDVGAKVRAGSPLATVASAEVGAEQSRLQTARSRIQLATANYARQKQLHQEGIAAEKDAWAARQEWQAAKADLAAAKAALGVVGSADGGAGYTLAAPIAGVVTARHAAIGRLVDTGKVLFEIVDTSSMWAEVEIPESEVAKTAEGQAVTLQVEGLADQTFSGVLSYVAPQIDPHTRTAKGRVALENPKGQLRANLFARGRISVAHAGSSVVVPRSAVQLAKGAHLVFVRLAQDEFEVRRVKVGAGDDQLVEIAGRVKAGDEVVTEGSFLLKTETLKESIGAGCCEAGENK